MMTLNLKWILLAGMAVYSLSGSTVALASDDNDIDSIYSRYDWQTDCTIIDASPPEGPGAYAQLVCPGPGDLQVMLSDDDARISMDYGQQVRFGPWESFPSFNDVSPTLEWRRQRLGGDMVPFATIHRWIVGSGDQQGEFLVVSTVAHDPGAESCMVGYVDATATPEANKMARRVADHVADGFRCGNDRPRAYGWVEIATPAPIRAGN